MSHSHEGFVSASDMFISWVFFGFENRL